MASGIVKFLIVFVVMTIGCTIVWDRVIADKLYDCTDAVGFDYWQPGNWIHGKYQSVPKVTHGRSMSEPDTIKAGWSVTGLWCLWFAFVGGSLVMSFFLAQAPWLPEKRKDPTLI
jgi:hypothetical protein